MIQTKIDRVFVSIFFYSPPFIVFSNTVLMDEILFSSFFFSFCCLLKHLWWWFRLHANDGEEDVWASLNQPTNVSTGQTVFLLEISFSHKSVSLRTTIFSMQEEFSWTVTHDCSYILLITCNCWNLHKSVKHKIRISVSFLRLLREMLSHSVLLVDLWSSNVMIIIM